MSRHARSLLAVIIAYVGSRLIYAWGCGVRFEAKTVDTYLQFIDPVLLRQRLLESLFYLREQPPLYNLFLGVGLKLGVTHADGLFHASYLACGLVFAVSLYLLMTRLSTSPVLSAAITILFTCSPINMLYESWLYYTYPLAAGLCVTALLLHRYLVDGRSRDAIGFWWIVAALVLARGIFHPLWMASIFIALYAWGRDRRQLVRCAGVPLALVLLLMVKNFVVFGTLVSGRMVQQVNAAVMTSYRLSDAERRRLIEEHKISPLSTIAIASDPDLFARHLPRVSRANHGIPLLDQSHKSNGRPNWNAAIYWEIGDLLGADARYVFRHYPTLYLMALLENVKRYAAPSDHNEAFNANRRGVNRALREYNRYFAGQFQPGGVAWFHCIGMPILLIFGAWRVRRRLSSGARAEGLTLLYCIYCIVFVSAVTILFSYGDHNRYRFKVSAFYCVLIALLVVDVGAWVRRFLERRAQ